MTTITQAITTLPDAPDPLTPATFEPKAAASVLAQKAMVTELQTWTGQVNTVAGEVNANALAAAAQVPLAEAQADIATEQAGIAASQATAAAESAETALNAPVAVAISNYAGRWELLTGPLSAPSSVYYGSAFWVLIEDVADITASVPGTTSAWVPATSPAVVSVVAMSKTTDYTIDAGDRGSRMSLSGSTSRTFTLPPAATAGDGWFCYVANAGDDTAEAANPVTLTIDGNGAETIEGVTTITEYRGGVVMLITDGTSWFAERIAGGLARFTQSGTFVWPVKAIASGEIIGAGGGGGGGMSTTTTGSSGGGGGAMRPVGPVSKAVNTADTVTVGAPGTGGASGGGWGSKGGYSRWLVLSAYGGGQGGASGEYGGGGGGWGAVGNPGGGGGTFYTSSTSQVGAGQYTPHSWGGIGAGCWDNGPGNAEWGGGAGGRGTTSFVDNAGGMSFFGGGGGGGYSGSGPGAGGTWGAHGTGGVAGTGGSFPTAGTNGTSRIYGCGDGGGSGGYSTGAAAGAKGGDGGIPGGGGGPGGYSTSGTGGVGGKGGRGEVRIWYQ